MPTSKDFSVEDEAYLATIAAEPKMTMDEVGADIEEHGHVPVTPETATQDPFTAKGSLAYALDEALSADTDLEKTIMTRDKNDHLDSHLTNPTDDFRDETKGEVEGTTSTPQGLIQPVESNKVGKGLEPTIQQDKAVQVKDSLAEALDAITMDGAEEIEAKPPIGKDPEPDLSKYNEEEASHIPLKAPKIPPSLGGAEDTPDANGLVYVTATFTVDPDKYVSNNYRPTNMGKAPDALTALKQKRAAMNSKPTANPEEEAALSDLGTPEAKESAASPDEPTPQQEEVAAKDADKEQKEEIEAEVKEEAASSAIPTTKKDEKPAQDEAPEKEVLDYATFIDGSSFICYDEVADIDYSKIAMDAGPKKAPTRANCQTTFAQCRAKNPLFCRFHGPKLLEADIKTAIKATVGPGCVVQVTKDKNSKNKFTFRLTVGCPPSKKKMVEKMVHMFLTQNPGITSSTEDWNLVGKHKQTQEFEMDILQADNPPQKNTWADQAKKDTKEAIKNHEKQAVVGETAPALEKKAAKGEKWETVDEDIENEWADNIDNLHKTAILNNNEFLFNFNQIANQFDKAHDAGDAEGLKQALDALKKEVGKYDEVTGAKKPEAADVQETTEEPAAPEAPQEQAEESKVGKPVSKPTASFVEQPSNDDEAEFDNLVNEAEEKGLFNNDDFQKKYQDIFFDGKKDMAAKVAAMKGLMADASSVSKTSPKSEGTTVDKVTKEDGNTDAERKTGGGETTVLPAPNAASKQSPQGKSPEMKDVMTALAGINGIVSDYNISYDATNANDPTEIEISAYGDGDFNAMLKKVDSYLSNVGYGVTADEDGMHIVKKGADAKKSGAFDKVKKALAGTGYENGDFGYDDFGDTQEVYIATSGNGEGTLEAVIGKDGGITFGVHDNNGFFGNSDDPKHAITDFEKNYGGKPPVQSNGGNAASSPHIEKAKELAKKLFDMKHEFSNVASGTDAETVNALNNALIGAQHTYDKLANQLDTIGELDAQMIAVGEDSDLFEVDKTFEQKLLEDSKKKAEGQASVLFDELESALSGIEKSFASAKELAADKKKGEIASSVEQTIKNLSVSIFGGKRPPQGVDSVADYLDYLKDELESDAEENITPDEMAGIEDQYHLEDYYKSTKAAAKALDDAIETFKDKMDEAPSQGEDYGAYQADIEQMQKSIGAQASEVLTNFEAYKNALGHCKYEAEAAKKLAESKKKLEGGGTQGTSSGGEEPKKSALPAQQAQQKSSLTDEEKKAKIAAMSPKQKVEAAVKIFKKKLAANPNDADAKAKLAKYEAMLAKLNK